MVLQDMEEVSTVYKTTELIPQQDEELKKVLNSKFRYGEGGEKTTLRELLNFENFFTGEDALIR